LNKNLVEHKQESVRVLKKALTVFLDFEKVAVSEFIQKIEPFYPQINGLNMTTNTEQNLRIITTIPNVFFFNNFQSLIFFVVEFPSSTTIN